jgi:hypothetical protein
MTVPWQLCERGSRETVPSPATPRWVPRCRWTAGPQLPHMPLWARDRADERKSAHPGYARDRPDDVRTSGTCHGWSIPETGLNDRNHS